MNVPQPELNESKQDYIERCINYLVEQEELSLSKASVIAYQEWNSTQPKSSLHDELMQRFQNIKDVLVKAFGKPGQQLLDYTLMQIGVYDPSSKKFNYAALNGNMRLPYIKSSESGMEIGGLVSPPVNFKYDAETGIVEGYANTVLVDTYADVFLPEAYKDSFIESYQKNCRPIFFMHHTDIDAGELLELKFDEVGMYVKTRPYPLYAELIKQGKLKGFSIGYYITIAPDVVGNAYVTHKKFSVYGDDISYVSSPANLLSYFTSTPQEFVDKRAEAFTAESKPLPQRNFGGALKTSQSFLTPGDVGYNIAFKEDTQMSDCKEQKNPEKEQKNEVQPPAQPKQPQQKNIYEMDTDELVNFIKQQAKEDVRQDLLKKAETQLEARKHQEEDAFKKQTQENFGKLFAKFDELTQTIEKVNAKVAIHDEKFGKFESEVADVPSNAASKTKTADKAIKSSVNFSEFLQQFKGEN